MIKYKEASEYGSEITIYRIPNIATKPKYHMHTAVQSNDIDHVIVTRSGTHKHAASIEADKGFKRRKLSNGDEAECLQRKS